MLQRFRPALTFTLIALLLLLPAGMVARAASGPDEIQATIDGSTIELTFPDGPAKVGPNAVLVRLRAADGQPIRRATVQIAPAAIAVSSADHGHADGAGHADAATRGHGDTAASGHAAMDMGEHSAAATQTDTHADAGHGDAEAAPHIHTIMTQLASNTDGSYTGIVHLDSAGAWQIAVHVSSQGFDHAVAFTVAVAESRPNGLILGGFVGINALIITAAAVIKRRMPAATKRSRPASAA